MAVIELKVPSIGESVTEVTLVKILKSQGSLVKLDDPLCEFESDKATFELPSEANGKITWLVTEGQDLKVGDVVAKIDTEVNDSVSETPPAINEKSKQKNIQQSSTFAISSKSNARKNIDSNQIEGTGKDGRITLQDAKSHIPAEIPAPKPVQESSMSSNSANTILNERSERREKCRA